MDAKKDAATGAKKQNRSTAAKNRYNLKNYDRVNLTMPKGRKEKLQIHAQNHGESLNGFINRAIDETVERDNTKA